MPRVGTNSRVWVCSPAVVRRWIRRIRQSFAGWPHRWLSRSSRRDRGSYAADDGQDAENLEFDDAGQPLPPHRLRRLVSHWVERDEWLQSGALDARLIRDFVEQHNGPLSDAHTILDFGCGCGRVARWLADLHGPRIYGSDYDSRLIEWCRANLPSVTVTTNGPEPPLALPPKFFDLIYAISLFTHLPGGAQERWLAELARLLRPGGTLLFTVHGEIFTNQLSADDRYAYAQGLLVVTNPEISGAEACAAFNPPADVRGRLLPSAGLEFVASAQGDWTHNQIWTPMVLQDKYLARKS